MTPNTDKFQFKPRQLKQPKLLNNIYANPTGIGVRGNVNKQLGNLNLNVGANKQIIDYKNNQLQTSNSPINYNANVSTGGKYGSGNVGLQYTPGSKPVYSGGVNVNLAKNLSANVGAGYNPNLPSGQMSPHASLSYRKRFEHGGEHLQDGTPVVNGMPIYSASDPGANQRAENQATIQAQEAKAKADAMYQNMQSGWARENLAAPMVAAGDATFVAGLGASATGVGATAGAPMMAAGTASSLIPRMSEQLSLRLLQQQNPDADFSEYISNPKLLSQAAEILPVAKAGKMLQKGYKFGKKGLKYGQNLYAQHVQNKSWNPIPKLTSFFQAPAGVEYSPNTAGSPNPLNTVPRNEIT